MLSACRLLGMAFERCFLSHTHTHILLVEGLKFLSTSGVARFLPSEEGKLRVKGAQVGVRRLAPGKFLEATSFSCRRYFLAQATQNHLRT